MASWYTSSFTPKVAAAKPALDKPIPSKRATTGAKSRRQITTSPRDDGAGPLLSPLRGTSSARRLVSAEGSTATSKNTLDPDSPVAGGLRSGLSHQRGVSARAAKDGEGGEGGEGGDDEEPALDEAAVKPGTAEPFGGPAAVRVKKVTDEDGDKEDEEDGVLEAGEAARIAAKVAGEEYRGFAERREPEPFMYPQYDGTKKAGASDAEKKRFHLARLQRMAIIREQLRPKLHSKPPKPRGILRVSTSSSNVRVVENINDLRRPHGVHMGFNRDVYCDCKNCVDNRETMLKADRWWLTGAQEKALGYQKLDCARLMPPSYCAIQFRSLRGVVRKGTMDNWQRPLIKELQLDESALEKMRADILTVDTHNYVKLLPSYPQIQAAIAEADRDIQKLLGSADWTAEVVVIVSSFGAVCTEFFKSYRILRFLEMKGVEHFTLDVNKDIGVDSVDYKLIRRLHADNRLPIDPKKVHYNAELPIVAPIVLVDGVPLGDFAELLTQEDEGDLDYVLSRAACANCLADRKSVQKHCLRCGAKFNSLISHDTCSLEEIQILMVRSEYNAGRIKAPSPLEWERRRRRLCLVRVGEDPSLWVAERHKFGVPSIGFAVAFD